MLVTLDFTGSEHKAPLNHSRLWSKKNSHTPLVAMPSRLWFPSKQNLELHLGYHTCWLSHFTIVCLWCRRMVSEQSQFSWMGRLPHFLSYGATPKRGALCRKWNYTKTDIIWLWDGRAAIQMTWECTSFQLILSSRGSWRPPEGSPRTRANFFIIFTVKAGQAYLPRIY